MANPETENPETENPETENPETENPETENPETENPEEVDALEDFMEIFPYPWDEKTYEEIYGKED